MDDAVLDFPFPTVPAYGTLEEVAPGVRWLRMPLPFALDHINLWVLDDGAGVTLVDTGISTDTIKGLWDTVFAGPLAGRPVNRVIATHFHPDHMGLAGWLCERFTAPLWATLGEWTFASMLHLDHTQRFLDNQLAFYQAAGFDAAGLEMVRRRSNPYPARVAPIPPALRRLRDGEAITVGGRSWRVIVGRGHSPEHACLWCPEIGVLISGDQVLPRISPNVSVWAQEPEADPLALFTASLARIRDMVPDDTLVLPSHGKPFRGLHRRIADLIAHHDERLAETLAACTVPKRAIDLMPVLFRRPLDDHQTFFAVGESLAHLHRLVAEGDLEVSVDADGVRWFRRTGA